jgi:hypothetical protein
MAPRRARRFLIALVDALIAGVAAVIAMRSFGTWACDDANPSVCSNFWGNGVPDGRNPGVILLSVFVAVFVCLVVVQLLVATARRRRDLAASPYGTTRHERA